MKTYSVTIGDTTVTIDAPDAPSAVDLDARREAVHLRAEVARLRIETQARAIDNARLETDLAQERMAVEVLQAEAAHIAANAAATEDALRIARAEATGLEGLRRRVADALGLYIDPTADEMVRRADHLRALEARQ